jgi:thiol-disulfide isomerase/thioredoxin
MKTMKKSPVLIVAALVLSVLTTSSCKAPEFVMNEDVNYRLAPEEIRSVPLKTLDGMQFKISEREGKVLLLNFWATWCIPCIEEMPHLVELQKELGPEGFEILGMNTEILTYKEDGSTFDELELKVRELVKAQGLNYEIVWTSAEAYEKAAEVAQFPGIPLSLLLDADGKIVGAFRGADPKTIERLKDVARKTVAARNQGA